MSERDEDLEALLPGALKRAAGEAAPRPQFAGELRERFLSGRLAEGLDPASPALRYDAVPEMCTPLAADLAADDAMEGDLVDVLHRASVEALPCEVFEANLRERFVDGSLVEAWQGSDLDGVARVEGLAPVRVLHRDAAAASADGSAAAPVGAVTPANVAGTAAATAAAATSATVAGTAAARMPANVSETAAATVAATSAPATSAIASAAHAPTVASQRRRFRPWWAISVAAAAGLLLSWSLLPGPEDGSGSSRGFSGLLRRWFGIGGGQQTVIVCLEPPFNAVATGSDPKGTDIFTFLTAEQAHKRLEGVFTDAEARLAPLPVIGGGMLRHLVIEGRPVLAPADVAFGGRSAELERVCRAMSDAEARAAREFPALAATPLASGPGVAGSGPDIVPVVCVLAPTRQVFEVIAGPRVEPLEVRPSMVALALREEGVLLLSPEVLDPDQPPCEALDIAHETVHAWLHARTASGARPPLWLEEGAADLVASASTGWDSRPVWRKMMHSLRGAGLDPFPGAVVLSLETYPDVVRHARSEAICDERRDVFLPVFHGQADTLVQFLSDTTDGEVRRDALHRFLARTVAGETFDGDATARALGFDDVPDLMAARDAWLDVEIEEAARER